MKFAIMSDTHGNVANFRKALKWFDEQGIENIFHCGDIGSPESLKESLEGFKVRIFGVFGNMDKDLKFSPWLYRIAHKLLLMLSRSKRDNLFYFLILMLYFLIR